MICPSFTCFFICSARFGSPEGILPFLSKLITYGLESTPITLNLALANKQAVDRPVRPHPMTLTQYLLRFSLASRSVSFQVIAVDMWSPLWLGYITHVGSSTLSVTSLNGQTVTPWARVTPSRIIV